MPALLIYLGLLLVACWRRLIPMRMVGPFTLLTLVVLVFIRLVLLRFGVLPDVGSIGDSLPMAVHLAGSFPFAFVIFGTRRGLQVSLLIYLAFLGLYGHVVIDGLLGRGAYPASPVATTLAIVFSMQIVLLRLLASRLEKLVAARTRVDVLAEQATTDPLTGLSNRRRLDDEFARLMAQSRRYDRPLSLVLIDLDLFKRVNDDFGHAVGDEVLIETVRRLSGAIRGADLLGRWGGEEFLLLAPNTDHADALALAERCRQAIAAMPMPIVGPVTASFGVGTYALDDDERLLMRRVDLALYTAKAQGRNCVIGIRDIDTTAITKTDELSRD